MKKSYIAALVSVFVLSGCGSIKYLRSSSTAEKMCSRYSAATTYDKILRGVRKHYTGSETQSIKNTSVYAGGITGTISQVVEGYRISNNNYEIIVTSHGPMHNFYGLLVKVKNGNQNNCKSIADIRYMNSFWKGRLSKVIKNTLR